MPSSIPSTGVQPAVGTPAAAMTSLANAFEPSRRAAARVGPNAVRPRDSSSSTRPATSGASGPTTGRATSSRHGRSADAGEVAVRAVGQVGERADIVDADVREGLGVLRDAGVARGGEDLGLLWG